MLRFLVVSVLPIHLISVINRVVRCLRVILSFSSFFFFNDTATTEIYTLSLHDALPISGEGINRRGDRRQHVVHVGSIVSRSEEHTSELQSHLNLVCRLLLEKKKNNEKLVDDVFSEHKPLLIVLISGRMGFTSCWSCDSL